MLTFFSFLSFYLNSKVLFVLREWVLFHLNSSLIIIIIITQPQENWFILVLSLLFTVISVIIQSLNNIVCDECDVWGVDVSWNNVFIRHLHHPSNVLMMTINHHDPRVVEREGIGTRDERWSWCCSPSRPQPVQGGFLRADVWVCRIGFKVARGHSTPMFLWKLHTYSPGDKWLSFVTKWGRFRWFLSSLAWVESTRNRLELSRHRS